MVWKNNTSNFHYTLVPHDEGMAGVAPQGHLALYQDTLIVAAGRAVPAFFDAATGKLLYHQCQGLFAGGAWTMASHDMAFFLRTTSWKPEDMNVRALKDSRSPSMQAYATGSGRQLWSVDKSMNNRNPVITSDTVYTRSGAFDLHTGREKTKSNPLTGKPELLGIEGRILCSAYSGAENILMHRSGSLGLVDMKRDIGHHHYPNIRAGCWLNMIELTMTLGPASDAPRIYRVVLHFAELDDVEPGDRVFDVKLQGKVVTAGLDVVKQAGGRLTVMTKEFRGIRAVGTMTLEIVKRSDLPPILSGLEVLAE